MIRNHNKKNKCEAEKILRFTELTDRFTARKTIFVCCSQKVVLRGRTTALLKICLRRQVFVCVETSRSHLAWSTDDRNLTDFLVIKTNLSKFCLKCDPCLSLCTVKSDLEMMFGNGVECEQGHLYHIRRFQILMAAILDFF